MLSRQDIAMSIDSDVAIGRLEWCARVPMAMCNVQCCRVCTVGRITSTRTSPNVTTSGGSRCIGTAASCTLPFAGCSPPAAAGCSLSAAGGSVAGWYRGAGVMVVPICQDRLRPCLTGVHASIASTTRARTRDLHWRSLPQLADRCANDRVTDE